MMMSIEEIIASLCDGCEHAPMETCDLSECRKRSIGFQIADMQSRIRFLEAAKDEKEKRLAQVTAERDAAEKFIPRTCETCIYWKPCAEKLCAAPGDTPCEYRKRQAWKWRGPQTEDGGNDKF